MSGNPGRTRAQPVGPANFLCLLCFPPRRSFSQGRRPQNGSASTGKLNYFSVRSGNRSNGIPVNWDTSPIAFSCTILHMSDMAAEPIEQLPPVAITLTRKQRLRSLVVVLSVSFANYILVSFHSLFVGTSGEPTQFRILISLVTETTSLLLLWLVLSAQGRSWRDIGWELRWRDVGFGIGLIVATKIAVFATNYWFQTLYRGWTGHYLQPRSVHTISASGLSVLSVLFVFVNPCFEELIVRGYTMSEIVALGGSRTAAILISVLIQVSYHTYQGLLGSVGVATAFTILALYFSRTRRIGPVIIAHFYSDASALIRSNF
jgi:membrane protease YdiL (CAAX protease family)